MRLENQVAPIEASERLRELGIVQDGNYSWLWDKLHKKHMLSPLKVEALELIAAANPEDKGWIEKQEKGIYSAFSVAELGVLLPDVYSDNQWVTISNAGNNKSGINIEPPFCYSLHIGESMDKLDDVSFDEELYPTEAQARAAYLIHLLENKLMTPEECNKRLIES